MVDPLVPERGARGCARCLDDNGLRVSSLAYYGNNLHPDPDERRATNDHVARCIDAAAELGCPTVGTFVGRDPDADRSPTTCATAEEIFPPLVERARERGVDIVIENCVMEGWHPDGYPGNLAYSPELWEWMFSLGLKLNFDPSHLMWLGIDPVQRAAALRRPRRARAGEGHPVLSRDQRNRYGFFGKAVDARRPVGHRLVALPAPRTR